MLAPRPAQPAAAIGQTVVFAAWIAVLGTFPGVYVGGLGVPIVVQNAGPVLAGCLVGARRGAASVVLLLALTAIGLPLLSGGRGGVAPFLGPSGGFLLGFVASAAVAGLLASRSGGRPAGLLLATAAGMLADYAVGIPWLGVYTGDLGTAAVQSLVFVPGDAVKAVVVALIAAVVHRALPGRLSGAAIRAR